jgi:hypothetical protein
MKFLIFAFVHQCLIEKNPKFYFDHIFNSKTRKDNEKIEEKLEAEWDF